MNQILEAARPRAQHSRRGISLNLHEGWIAGILLVLMLGSVTASLSSANWTDGLWQTLWAALGGLAFGALVARLRLNGALAVLLATIVGAAFVAWLVSGHVSAPPDATWNEKMLLIEDRIDEWLVRVLAGGIGTDAFVFLIVMCALMWFIGYTAAWSVFRHHQPWGAILPAGAALLLNQFYAPPQSGIYLMVFLLTSLLLLVRTTLLKRQQTWAAHAVRFANDIGLDFLTYGVVFSGLIILLAWLIPPTAPGPLWFGFLWERTREPWQQVQDDVSRAFSTLRGVNSAAPTTYFSSSLTMGGPIRLGDRDVFEIESNYGRYWRAVVFDSYTGKGWVTTADESASLPAGDSRLRPMPMERRREVTQTIEVRLPTDNLVVEASQPVQVSEVVDAKFKTIKPSGDQSFLDIYSLRLQRPVQLGDKYTVVSSLSAADEGALRNASTQVPAYIRDRYLGLPASVPQRVRDLALRLTATQTSNYDKARAIEQHLREHITYNESVEPIPEGWDGVDYVLFERPEGYCNYYASAMAVMARSVGIPARVASGYSVATPSDDGLYHINERNAHSWPELYLGELGWIEFEPTSGRPEITRPVPQAGDQPENLADKNQDGTADSAGGINRQDELEQQAEANAANTNPLLAFAAPIAVPLGGLVVVALLAGVAVFGVQWQWRRQLRSFKPGARALAEMYRFAPFAGLDDRSGATADERAGQLTALMPDAAAPIAQVNAAYVRERYGAQDLAPEESDAARTTALVVQKKMWRTVYDRSIGSQLHALRTSIENIPNRFKRG